MMLVVLYILLGVAPSLAWLAYYLHKDNHPEPKRLVLLMFIVGMLLSLPAVGLEFLVLHGTTIAIFSAGAFLSAALVFWPLMAFIEEALKFVGMKWTAVPHPHFTHPVDAMVYMIIAGLGFAAAENVFFNFAIEGSDVVQRALLQALQRGLSATLLHALAAAITGYFFARSLALDHRHRWNLAVGLLTATVLHTLHNYIIILNRGPVTTIQIIVLIVLLGGAGSIVSLMFRNLERFPSFVEEHRAEHDDGKPPPVLERQEE